MADKKQLAAKVVVVGSFLFVILLALLHGLEPEFKPSWRLISEYELGAYGWLMRVAFFSLAISGFSLLFALLKQYKGVMAAIGKVLLAIASIGLVLAGSFQTDAVNVPREAWTTHGAMHAWGALMVIPTAPILAALLTLALTKKGKFAAIKWGLWSMTALIWISFILFSVSGGTKTDGSQTAADWYGWPNRVFIVSYALWLALCAWGLLRTRPNNR